MISSLVGLGLPVLCVDTCTVLDVVRDITRESVMPEDVYAGLALLAMAESGSGLTVLMAEQVSLEIASNIVNVEEEAQVALEKFLEQAQRIHDVAGAYGAQGPIQVRHLDGHTSRARPVLDRWLQVAQVVPHNDGVSSRAFRRVNEPRTPARRGKESMKDCVIVEAYIEAASQLRASGMKAPMVFASSNTKEYFASNTRHLKNDIAADLASVGLEYAPNWGAAKHSLGR
ncbi:PIN domain-containing protein [Hydrogenophaga pseudoflava]|uniref:PIN domain-containing protein n=1 Tax=Hydrogenophaga pseudoflava TaxID=47421 RepID=UPI0027E593F9|nr:PIN domain-containing protein [Hydrogenophaga pseudoflava]MDQ7746338.1 PIN domain-containing protein [Hydrogenophaga pseudoflava]